MEEQPRTLTPDEQRQDDWWLRLVDLLNRLRKCLGVQPMGKLDAVWDVVLDDTWHLAVNGTSRSWPVGGQDGRMQINVPPAHLAVWYNGWLACLANLAAQKTSVASVAAGSGASEITLLAAIKRAVERAQQPHDPEDPAWLPRCTLLRPKPRPKVQPHG